VKGDPTEVENVLLKVATPATTEMPVPPENGEKPPLQFKPVPKSTLPTVTKVPDPVVFPLRTVAVNITL
jgi:hypothetical protein